MYYVNQLLVVGEPCLFHSHDYRRNPILLASTRLPLRRHRNWCAWFSATRT